MFLCVFTVYTYIYIPWKRLQEFNSWLRNVGVDSHAGVLLSGWNHQVAPGSRGGGAGQLFNQFIVRARNIAVFGCRLHERPFF